MSVLSRWSLPVSIVAALAATAPPDLSAQFFSFGQNKIQYRKLDWKILRGPHVDLYYYPAEAELAPAALAYAESSYDTLAVQFGHDVAERYLHDSKAFHPEGTTRFEVLHKARAITVTPVSLMLSDVAAMSRMAGKIALD